MQHTCEEGLASAIERDIWVAECHIVVDCVSAKADALRLDLLRIGKRQIDEDALQDQECAQDEEHYAC